MNAKFLYSFWVVFLLSINLFSQIGEKYKDSDKKEQQAAKPYKTLSHSTLNDKIFGEITTPPDSSLQDSTFIVSGTIKNLPAKYYLWLINRPQAGNSCWPQYNCIVPDVSGRWRGPVTIGGPYGEKSDILLVVVNELDNKFFNDYRISENQTHNFPGISMPLGTVILDYITVTRTPRSKFIKSDSTIVNKHYGFTKDGIFYIHKSLVGQFGTGNPSLISVYTDWGKGQVMQFDGNYYFYGTKVIFNDSQKIRYNFLLSSGIYLPDALRDIKSPLINESDCILNSKNDGHNFYTSPQDYYPGNK